MSTSVRAGVDERLSAELARWTDAAIITDDQAAQIRSLEAARVPSPGSPRIPLVAEALGFLGGTLAAVAGVLAVSRFWDDLTTGVRLALVGAVAALLVGAGRVVRAGADPALDHLGSFLWVIATGATAMFAGIVGADVVDLDGPDVALGVGVAIAGVAGALWAWRPAPLQHATTLLGLAVTVGAAVGRIEHVGGRFVGIAFWALGALWVLGSWRGLLRPTALGEALGAALTVLASRVVAGEFSAVADEAVAVATAVGWIAISVPAGSLVLLWVGVAGVFLSVPFAVSRYFGDSAAAPLALFVAGMALIGTAVLAARLVREVKEQQATRRQMSDRSVTGAALATVAVVVVLLVGVTPFRSVPSFPSLRRAPDPAIAGTVAYVSTRGDTCIRLVAASGSTERDLVCGDEMRIVPDELWWDDGALVGHAWTTRDDEYVRIDTVTGEMTTVTDQATVAAFREGDIGGGWVPRPADGATLEPEETAAGHVRLVLRTGEERRTVFAAVGPIDYWLRDVRWSPDGTRAVVADSEDRLLVLDLDGTESTARLLATDARSPAWGAVAPG